MEDYPKTSDSSPSSDIRHGVRQLAGDVVTLAELQTDLLQVELRQWLHSFAAPTLILVLTTIVVALASLPVLLMGLAYLLSETTELSLAAATLIAGGIGLLVAVVCGALAWRRARRSGGAFGRSRVELARNVRWLKQVLSRPTAAADDLSTDSGRIWPR